MIDKLVLQIPFSNAWVRTSARVDTMEFDSPDPFSRTGIYFVDQHYLPIKKEAKTVTVETGEDGKRTLIAEDIRCPWESLPTSHGGLAMKAYPEGNGFCNWPYLEIKCSPAKLTQGHNVYGFDDLATAAKNMFWVLHSFYPSMFGGLVQADDFVGPPLPGFLNFDDTRVSEIDITYAVAVPSEIKRMAFIKAMHTLSKGQTKARGDSFETTAYFGAKKSKLKKIKVYLKGPEVINENKERKKKGQTLIPDEIVATAKNLVRIEATLKKEWLERRGFPVNLHRLLSYLKGTSKDWYRNTFTDATKDLWNALEGQEITVMSDDKIYKAIDRVHGDVRGKTARVFGFYQAIRAVGLETLKGQYNERTFRRMVTDLRICGFSDASLCSLHNGYGNVIQIAQVVNLSALHEPIPEGVEQVRLFAA